MADIDIAERRRPQDGRISLRVSGKQIDLRVSTLPTIYGEKVVMRILDSSTAMLTLTDLGFLPDTAERYEESYTKPYGTILVTGPTGSGKSTTLYATLNVINKPQVNIITVEDPVEYRLSGINQVQVNKKAGLNFANALRSFLRQDPDVMLVGEIRDIEAANIAIESALTGHLVLSTLHTNDAPASISRLVEMGVEPFLVGSAVDAILAQRLARALVQFVQILLPADPRRIARSGVGNGDARQRCPNAVPTGGLCGVFGNRIQGSPCAARADARDRRRGTADRGTCADGRHCQGGTPPGHAAAQARRSPQGGGRPDIDRRDPAGRGLTLQRVDAAADHLYGQGDCSAGPATSSGSNDGLAWPRSNGRDEKGREP